MILVVAVAAAALLLVATAACASDANEFARVVIVGATGNLAAKYLWVAAFRLALQAREADNRTFAFVAAATDSQAAGDRWLRGFFDAAFLRRVCDGESEDSEDSEDLEASCTRFFREDFVPSVRYAPLRDEAHYAQLREALEREDTAAREVGRLVYLAVPPKFFAQSSELAHTYLRPPSVARAPQPFFRVVVEKPFGSDLASAQALHSHLRQFLKDDEIYLIDHYAGKAAVQALADYLERNRALLRPKWSARHVREIEVRMSETETCERRVQFFHSTGIIRDVMVNHLQLLLGLALGRYEAYAAHYELEIGSRLPEGGAFVPTAALVELESRAAEWEGARFVLSAAKAARERRLDVRIRFRAPTASDAASAAGCELRVTIQTEKNASPPQSQRIEWSCSFLDGLAPPRGWEVDALDHRAMRPAPRRADAKRLPWELGDSESAYDVLLRDVALGNRQLFASMEETIASWALWSPIVQLTERAVRFSSEAPARGGAPTFVEYAAGNALWFGDDTVGSSQEARDEL